MLIFVFVIYLSISMRIFNKRFCYYPVYQLHVVFLSVPHVHLNISAII